MRRMALGNPWAQRILLIVFIVAIFWHGLRGGVPRSDQLGYLQQVKPFTSLSDILLNSPSWNRTQANPGDSILFRPVLYSQLGSFYYFFGYNFFLWQLAALILHILVVLGLYALFSQGKLRGTAYPFLLSLLFGSSFMGSECVFWSNVSGYLTFSALAVYSILFLVKYFSTENERYAWAACLLGVASEFTYEIGVVLNLLIAASFLYKWLQAKSKRDLKWAMMFLVGVLIYPVLSILDLWILGINPASPVSQISGLHKLLLGIWYSAVQIIYWLGGWMLPSIYDVRAYDRLILQGIRFSGLFSFVNFVAVLLLIYIAYYVAGKKTFLFLEFNRRAILAALGPLIFICGYSLVIAYGRAVPRPQGLEYVLRNNFYYSYIFYLAFLVGITLFTVKYDGNANLPDKGRRYLRKLIQSLLLMIIIMNAFYTFMIGVGYRYQYSAHWQRVIHKVERWLKEEGKAPNAYFMIDEDCFEYDWARLSIPDVMWPEKSFKLHEDDTQANKYEVYNIRCSD